MAARAARRERQEGVGGRGVTRRGRRVETCFLEDQMAVSRKHQERRQTYLCRVRKLGNTQPATITSNSDTFSDIGRKRSWLCQPKRIRRTLVFVSHARLRSFECPPSMCYITMLLVVEWSRCSLSKASLIMLGGPTIGQESQHLGSTSLSHGTSRRLGL
jgi:hypothetical protein